MANKKNGKANAVIDKLEPISIDLSKSSKAYKDLIKAEKKDKDIQKLEKVINSGDTVIRQTQRQERRRFDLDIIHSLEDGLEAIEKIVATPRTFIKEQAELVQVGLAKKISSLSIRHFATHSQFVRNINENNEVVPEKVLTILSESDTAIYENRMVMTLIKRCLSFIQKRAEFINEHMETRDSDLLLIHNRTQIDNLTYEVDTRIKVSTPSEEDYNADSETLAKLNELKSRCHGYFSTPFMTEMRTARDVSSPIHMTNMIVKNPDYHRCYEFWNFLDGYEELGVSYDVKETNKKFDDEYLREIKLHIANSIATLHSNRINDKVYRVDVEKTFTPEVIFTLEDETYEEGRFLYDAYPEAKEKRKSVFPLSSGEVKVKEERLNQRLKNQRDAEKNVRKAIQKDKDEKAFAEAQARKKRAQEIFDNYDDLILEIKALKKENAKLEKQVEELSKKKK